MKKKKEEVVSSDSNMLKLAGEITDITDIKMQNLAFIPCYSHSSPLNSNLTEHTMALTQERKRNQERNKKRESKREGG